MALVGHSNRSRCRGEVSGSPGSVGSPREVVWFAEMCINAWVCEDEGTVVWRSDEEPRSPQPWSQ